jgi:hypothetical protein
MISIYAGKTTIGHVMMLWKYKPIRMTLFDQEVGPCIKVGNVAGRQGGGKEIMSATVKQKKKWI